MKYSEYDFKYAKLILHDMEMRKEIEDIIKNANFRIGRNVKPTPAKILTKLFIEKKWQPEYSVSKKSKYLRFDLFKNKVAIEIQFADPSDCYNCYLKFLLAYNAERIDVGVIIVYDKSVKGKNLPKLEKVKSDLEIFRRILSCPIWVIGLKAN